MNTLNEEDEDTSKRVQEFFRRIMADNTKHEVLAGSYRCADDDKKIAALHGFLGTMILQCNIQIKVGVVSTIICHSTNTQCGPYEDRAPLTRYTHLDQPSRDLLGIASYLSTSWHVCCSYTSIE